MIPGLSESQLWQYATAEVFGRGRSYYDAGAVVSVVQRGQEVQAQVEGSGYAPYRVRIIFDEGGLTGAECSCPYEWDAFLTSLREKHGRKYKLMGLMRERL